LNLKREEGNGGPAPRSIDLDVLFRLGIPAADEADLAGKERKRVLSAWIEEPFGG